MDIIAPILLMFGVRLGTAANASLLGNFEIVATTIIAYKVIGKIKPVRNISNKIAVLKNNI